MKNKTYAHGTANCLRCSQTATYSGLPTVVDASLGYFFNLHLDCVETKEYFCINGCGTITFKDNSVCYRCLLADTPFSMECTRSPQHDGPCNGLPSATCLVFRSPVQLVICKCEDPKCSSCDWAAVVGDLCKFCSEVCEQPAAAVLKCSCYFKCDNPATEEYDLCSGCVYQNCNSPKRDEARFRRVLADKPKEEEEKSNRWFDAIRKKLSQWPL